MEKINIFFDLFGVITSEGYFATNVFYPLVKDRVNYDLFKKKYLVFCLGIISDDDFWEGIEINGDRDVILQRVFHKTYLNEDVCMLIKELKECHDLYIASEVPRAWAIEIIRKAGLENCFKKYFFSSDLKITKPFSGFYKSIIECVGGSNKNIFIDDTLDNLNEVVLLGADSIYFNKSNKDFTIKHKIANNSKEINKILCNL